MILDAIRGPEANVTSKSPRYNVPPMRLLLKFNLILILVFGAGVAAADDGIRRRYADLHFQAGRPPAPGAPGADRHVPGADRSRIYAATEAFNYLHGDYPGYTYKEATLNSTTCGTALSIGKLTSFRSSARILSRRSLPESATHLLDERCSWPRSCRLRRWWGLQT